MKREISEFALKGIFGSYSIKNMQTSGLLRTPTYSIQEKKDHDLFVSASESIRFGSSQMQRYYRILYVFENLVREFINNTLSELDGEGWFDKRATIEMKKKLATRKANESKNQWHTGRNQHPLFYLDFGDLALLIINHWDLFGDFFPDQAWVTGRVSDSERSRNVIAHTNELAADEGARLEMHLKDWIKQIG